MDRFIPCRSGMDMGYAQSMLCGDNWKAPAVTTASSEGYQRLLRQALLGDRTRILAFKPPTPTKYGGGGGGGPFSFAADHASSSNPARPRRHIPTISELVLDGEDLIDHPSLNLMDWGSRNGLIVALGDTVFYCDFKSNPDGMKACTTARQGQGPVTSVTWDPDGRHFALGLDNSDVQVWDAGTGRLLENLPTVHQSHVGSLAWHGRALATAGGDGLVVTHDLRVRSHVTHTYRGHRRDVCNLKWSASGKHLASAGIDHLVHIWDVAMNPARPSYVHRFEDHVSRVRALAWCPFRSNLLASGGGPGDRCIKLWDTRTGICLKSTDTGSHVSALLWNPNEGERQLLSSHCDAQKQLTLWNYPSMARITDLKIPITHPLYMAASPDRCTVASAGNETVLFSNIFGDPKVPPKHKKDDSHSMLARFGHIRFSSILIGGTFISFLVATMITLSRLHDVLSRHNFNNVEEAVSYSE